MTVLHAQAEDRIWSAIIVANNVEQPKPPTPELAQIAEKVRRVFGYNQVELIGSATKDIDDEDQCERWLVPSQNFWLNVRAKRAEAAYLLKVSLFHDKRTLVETEVKLQTNTPFLIRGPMHARGQIVVALLVAR